MSRHAAQNDERPNGRSHQGVDEDMTEQYEKLTLPNGVRILYEKIPYVRSVSAGIWVGVGSRFEKAAESGVSHFIEHMVFKGTATRSAAELAMLIDGAGGQTDAYTSKENTCFYGKALDSHLDLLLDVLCDMFFNSVFRPEDVEAERGVILEEIGMYEDAPEDLCSERLFAGIYKGHPLARPILGTPATLGKMTGESMKAYMDAHYLGGNIVIALSGSFEQRHIDYLAERFAVARPGAEKTPKAPLYKPTVTAKRKRIEQNHLCLAFPACSFNSPERYKVQLLNNIFGGGMSSRLFQTLREKLGLCYSVYSFTSAHCDTGILGLGTALSDETEGAAIAAMTGEIKKLLDGGVTPDELHRAREQVKSGVLMSLESTSARMNRLARGELFLGEITTAEELIERYNAVTEDDILAAARAIFRPELASLSAVGRTRPAEEYGELIRF